MKNTIALMFVAAAIVTLAPRVAAKGDTTRITIAGGGLATPIVIIDPAILKRFNVWTGPGTGGTVQGVEWKATDGFVIASATPVDDRPQGLRALRNNVPCRSAGPRRPGHGVRDFLRV